MPKRPRFFRGSRHDAGETVGDAFWNLNAGSWDWDFDFDGLVGVVVSVLGLLLIGTLLFTVVIPLLALTAELVAVVLLFAAGVLGRLVFGRPWLIEASTKGPPPERRGIYVHGLRGSREAVTELAADIAAGRTPAQTST
jgi:hypothetical protein